MKLRSGKVLPERVDRLPEDLENLLEDRLQEFKKMFSANPQHGEELLKLLSKCRHGDHRIDVKHKVQEIYDISMSCDMRRLKIAYDLMKLIINNYDHHDHHDIIAKRVKNFDCAVDLEADLIGNIEE